MASGWLRVFSSVAPSRALVGGVVARVLLKLAVARGSQLAADHEILQAHRVFELDPGLRLVERFAEIGRLGKRRHLRKRARRQ